MWCGEACDSELRMSAVDVVFGAIWCNGDDFRGFVWMRCRAGRWLAEC